MEGYKGLRCRILTYRIKAPAHEFCRKFRSKRKKRKRPSVLIERFYHKYMIQISVLPFTSSGAILKGCTDMRYGEREECGYGVDNATECASLDCCWVPSGDPGAPWCFYHPGKLGTVITYGDWDTK